MPGYQLLAHPALPTQVVRGVFVDLRHYSDGLVLAYRIDAEVGRIALPPSAGSGRADGLWQTTCAELFLADDAGYLEMNFSPAGTWAAYRFDGYRAGMREAPVGSGSPLLRPPVIVRERRDWAITIRVDVGFAPVRPVGAIGLSVVVAETDGAKSFWALAHPPKGPPDFHHPACFAATLPAPGRP